MTKEARRTYRVSSMNVEEINFVFSLLADRIDELEGRRGNPDFKSDLNVNNNKIKNVGDAVDDGDAVSKGDATDIANSSSADAANNAVLPINTTLTASQNWLTYHRVVDTNNTIIHAFDATTL